MVRNVIDKQRVNDDKINNQRHENNTTQFGCSFHNNDNDRCSYESIHACIPFCYYTSYIPLGSKSECSSFCWYEYVCFLYVCKEWPCSWLLDQTYPRWYYRINVGMTLFVTFRSNVSESILSRRESTDYPCHRLCVHMYSNSNSNDERERAMLMVTLLVL